MQRAGPRARPWLILPPRAGAVKAESRCCPRLRGRATLRARPGVASPRGEPMTDGTTTRSPIRVLAVYPWPAFWSMGEGRGAAAFFLSVTSFPRHGHEMHVLMPGPPGAPAEEDYHGVHLHRMITRIDFMPERGRSRVVQHARILVSYVVWRLRAARAGLALAEPAPARRRLRHGRARGARRANHRPGARRSERDPAVRDVPRRNRGSSAQAGAQVPGDRGLQDGGGRGRRVRRRLGRRRDRAAVRRARGQARVPLRTAWTRSDSAGPPDPGPHAGI